MDYYTCEVKIMVVEQAATARWEFKRQQPRLDLDQPGSKPLSLHDAQLLPNVAMISPTLTLHECVLCACSIICGHAGVL